MITGISHVRPIGGPQPTTQANGPAAAAGAGADFGKVLADMATSTVDAMKAGESAAIGGINGTRSVQEVVDTVMNAEQALQTAIAVRDKLLTAYQEISRMAI